MIAPTIASTSQFARRMQHAFAGLTVTQQQALYLTTVERRPVGEVAYELGLPAAYVTGIATDAGRLLYEAVAS